MGHMFEKAYPSFCDLSSQSVNLGTIGDSSETLQGDHLPWKHLQGT